MKLYADEEGADVARRVRALAVAEISRVEVVAALWRKTRLGELAPDLASALVGDFEADWYGTDEEPPRFAAVVADASLLDVAARMCATHGLRAYDAVQLASARAARDVDARCDAMLAFDGGLRRAAAAEGFDLVPSSLDR